MAFAGKWETESQVGYDEFCKLLGETSLRTHILELSFQNSILKTHILELTFYYSILTTQS